MMAYKSEFLTFYKNVIDHESDRIHEALRLYMRLNRVHDMPWSLRQLWHSRGRTRIAYENNADGNESLAFDYYVMACPHFRIGQRELDRRPHFILLAALISNRSCADIWRTIQSLKDEYNPGPCSLTIHDMNFEALTMAMHSICRKEST